MSVPADVFLSKAQESLAGAESEFVNGRYNNCANRCYDACFQAAIAALLQEGVQPSGQHREWQRSFVQAEFVGQLINRRKRYPAELRDTLPRTFAVRQAADYHVDWMSKQQMERVLRRTRTFVQAIQQGGG